MVTPGQLLLLAPNCDADAHAPALSAAAAEFGIVTPMSLAMWLAQMFVESAGFTRLEENLNYSAPRLVAVWPNRFPDIAAATPYAGNPQALAEKVYGGRADLGNNEAGDGWAYHGRGDIMTTGRANYALTGAALGLDLIGSPEQLATPAVAARAAGFFWEHHGLGALAEQGDIVAVTRAINGGLNGLAERQAAYAQASNIFGAPA
jgi:putative chitinase